MSYERKPEEMIEITFFRKELNQKLLFYIKIKPSQRNLVCLIYFSTRTFSVSFVRKINLSRAGNCALAFDLKIFDNETQTFLSLTISRPPEIPWERKQCHFLIALYSKKLI